MRRTTLRVLLLTCAVSVSGCDKVADSGKAVQSVTYRAFNDSKNSWREFLTYHPPEPAPLPQTRYCYQMQSDITCYDSEQTMLTSKLVGYQDGENISWVQPGGGSLGASGGGAVALRPVPPRSTTNETPSINDFLPNLNFSWPKSQSQTVSAAPQGAIEVQNLPPINSVAKVGQKVN